MAENKIITPDSTIPQVLEKMIQIHRDRIALIEGDQRITYREFGESVHSLAAGFQDLGIQPGEKLAIIFPNGIKFPIVIFAGFQMGAVVHTVNPTLRPNEIKHILNDSEAVAVVVAGNFPGMDPLGLIRRLRPELPHLKYVIVDGQPTGDEISFSELIQKGSGKKVAEVSKVGDLVALIYTSGTTGLPKGSMFTHWTILYTMSLNLLKRPTFPQLIDVVRRYGFGYLIRVVKIARKPLTVMYTPPPYVAAGILSIILILLNGRTGVLQERFTPAEAIKLIEKEKVNVLIAVPSLATLVARNPALKKHNLNSLLYLLCGAAFVSPALVREIRENIGVPTIIGYGATEVGVPTVTNPFTDSEKMLSETVGRVMDGFELKIVDENRQPVQGGEVGEIAVRAPSVMMGYYKAEEKTRETIDKEGWCYTGDLGRFDEDGYLRISGRIKDMIIRAGQNIYPAELESVMVKHPKIHQVTVVGTPDDIAGEKVVAFVIPRNGFNLTKLEVLNFCRDNMAPYKVPGEVIFVDEFPMNATGKVLKRVLREDLVKSAELQLIY